MPHLPARDDVPQVQQILSSRGLPAELVLDIMELAGYHAGEGRLKVPHDPFHRENRDELAKYLKYCWELLVRCEMLANVIGKVIPWEKLIYRSLVPLLQPAGMEYTRQWRDRYAEVDGIYTYI